MNWLRRIVGGITVGAAFYLLLLFIFITTGSSLIFGTSNFTTFGFIVFMTVAVFEFWCNTIGLWPKEKHHGKGVDA